MQDAIWLARESSSSLARILPNLEKRFANEMDEAAWLAFVPRVREHFEKLFSLMHSLYGDRYDFFYHLESVLSAALRMWLQRDDDLRALDAAREVNPQWFESSSMVGASCYLDCFGPNIEGFRSRIPYFKELGISYLHLMPLFLSPDGDNDGGYAISSYREVDPQLGTMDELSELATELRQHGISLVLDFVFNHTSDEHEWAKKALAGEEEYQNYYYIYPDRVEPNAYEGHLAEIFPSERPGSFTYSSQMRKWVWTTFFNFQWDLNYRNPVVFTRMVEEMLFLANMGVEVLRLDAIAFIWKELETNCQNLPEAHTIVQAFNTIARIAAPALVFKSEAIVHPDEVKKYIREDECQLSYNPNLMALLWEALATRKVTLLRHSMQKRFNTPFGCAWTNYIRCHDDIGWAFSDDDASEVGLNGNDHRRFLSDFYLGKVKDTFSRGLPFQANDKTGDVRISGTLASLAGLEIALESKDEEKIKLAIGRIHMLHGVILTIGGIPLLFLGDELGLLNDYQFKNNPERESDSRWVHRPLIDWQEAKQRKDPENVMGHVFNGILRLIQVRQRTPAFSGTETEFIETGNDHVLGFFRTSHDQSVLVLSNFSEEEQSIAANRMRMLGIRRMLSDIVAGKTLTASHELILGPYQFMVLVGVR